MRNFTPITIEWDSLGWFEITILHVELWGFEGALFSIWFRFFKRFIVELFFIRFEIPHPFT